MTNIQGTKDYSIANAGISLLKKDESRIIGNYKIGKTIGEGTFGKVKIGKHIPTGENVIFPINQVAIKILEKDKIKDKNLMERVQREILILKSLKHVNIIHLYEV